MFQNTQSDTVDSYSFDAPVDARTLASCWRDTRGEVEWGVVSTDAQFKPAETTERNFQSDGQLHQEEAVVVPYKVIINKAQSKEQAQRAKVAYAQNHDVAEDALKVAILNDHRL